MALFESSFPSNAVAKKSALKQRRRNIQYLILNFLQDEGLIDTANTFIQEAKLSNEYQLCDNIDLDIILQDFSSYYSLKFNKQPLICKKNNESENSQNGPASNNVKRNRGNIKRDKVVPAKQQEDSTTKQEDTKEPLIKVTPLMNCQIKDASGDTKSNIDKLPGVEEIKPFGNFIKNLSLEFKEIAENIFYSTKPKYGAVTWSEIAGLENAKKHLREAVIYPLIYPKTFKGVLSPWSGILLFGPPGGGKTLLVKALLHEFNRPFFNVSASIVVSKWRGESEKYIKVLFELARYYAPSIIFIDEFEALTSRRDSINEHEASRRLKHELLIELDGLCKNSENLLFLATTNLPWEVDPAVLRRFEKRIFVPLPNRESREIMFKHFLKGVNYNDSNVNIKVLSEKTEGYSGSDIKVICKEAAMVPIRKNIHNMENGGNLGNSTYLIEQADLEQAVKKIRPTAKQLTDNYIKWAGNMGAE